MIRVYSILEDVNGDCLIETTPREYSDLDAYLSARWETHPKAFSRAYDLPLGKDYDDTEFEECLRGMLPVLLRYVYAWQNANDDWTFDLVL